MVTPPFSLSLWAYHVIVLFTFYLMSWAPGQRDTHRANSDPHRCLRASPYNSTLVDPPTTGFYLLQAAGPMYVLAGGEEVNLPVPWDLCPNSWQMGNPQQIANARQGYISVPGLRTHPLPSHLPNVPRYCQPETDDAADICNGPRPSLLYLALHQT